MSKHYVPYDAADFNENVAETLAATALRRCEADGGVAASRLLLVAAVYRHLEDATVAELLTVVRQTLENAGAIQ